MSTAITISDYTSYRHSGGNPKEPRPPERDTWLVRMAERYRWFRVLLHLVVMIRSRRHVRWHLRCIWREIYGQPK